MWQTGSTLLSNDNFTDVTLVMEMVLGLVGVRGGDGVPVMGIVDMEVNKVADEVANMVVDMKVDKVADIVMDFTDMTLAIGDTFGDDVRGGVECGGHGG